MTVWGASGENCAAYLQKRRPVAIDGRLEWREWQDSRSGQKREAVSIVADKVQFLGSRDQANSGDGGFAPDHELTTRFAGATAGDTDDDLPF